jgi:hypothetical protein
MLIVKIYCVTIESNNDIKSVTERTGIRSLAIDPSKKLIACGDRNGTIRIFSFDNFEKLATIEAHDAEIMVLDFAVIGKSLIGVYNQQVQVKN